MSLLAVDPVPLTSFGREPLWLILVKVLAIFVALVVATLFTIVAERVVVARMQQRRGPNRTGPGGSLQSLADGLKLAFKEDIRPLMADKYVYAIAPVLSVVPAFLAFSVIPFGPEVSVAGERTPLQLTDLSVGVLFILACGGMGVYGIILAGWASGSTYPLLGSLRSAAQVISYEIPMALSFVPVFLYAGSLSTSDIVAAQSSLWFAITLPVSFAIYCVAMVGEVNRAPFDLPEAESELVGGFHTEYSSLKFALFFLAEYINMVTVSALAVTLFLGGWQAPWPLSAVGDGMFNRDWWPLLWFTAKTLVFLFVFIWLRGTLPRQRYDQFMRLGWQRLVPIALAWAMLVAGVRMLTEEFERADVIRYGGIGLAVLLVVLVAVPQRKPEPEPEPVEDQGDGYDAYGRKVLEGGRYSGFPIPPLDLVVPPRPVPTAVAEPVRVASSAPVLEAERPGGPDGPDSATTTGEEPDRA